MTRVALVVHHEREVAVALAREAVAWLVERDHEAWVIPDDATELGLGDLVSEQPLDHADLVVCLGGDGTMLRAVRLLDGAPVPLLGVNVGVLGYLTEIDPPELTSALERFVAGPEAGRWHLDERMMLQVAVGRQRRGHRGGRSTRRSSRSTSRATPSACWRASPARRSRATPPTA